MKAILKTIALAFALMTLSTHAEEAPKAPLPISKEAKHPPGIDLKLMSEDPTYGYSEKNPIKVGGKEETDGPKAEREYLDSILDRNGKPIKYERLGSGGQSPDGNILDIYEVTLADGTKIRLWIDMYHAKNKPAKQPAPVGFYKKKG